MQNNRKHIKSSKIDADTGSNTDTLIMLPLLIIIVTMLRKLLLVLLMVLLLLLPQIKITMIVVIEIIK